MVKANHQFCSVQDVKTSHPTSIKLYDKDPGTYLKKVLLHSGAPDAYPKWNSSSATFVRPDVDQPVEESWNAFNRNIKAASPSTARPQFRSALEQVSFETSENLMERVSVAKPQGFFGMAARIFGK